MTQLQACSGTSKHHRTFAHQTQELRCWVRQFVFADASHASAEQALVGEQPLMGCFAEKMSLPVRWAIKIPSCEGLQTQQAPGDHGTREFAGASRRRLPMANLFRLTQRLPKESGRQIYELALLSPNLFRRSRSWFQRRQTSLQPTTLHYMTHAEVPCSRFNLDV